MKDKLLTIYKRFMAISLGTVNERNLLCLLVVLFFSWKVPEYIFVPTIFKMFTKKTDDTVILRLAEHIN